MEDSAEPVMTDSEAALKQYLTHESEALLRTLRLYVWRSGLADGQDTGQVAADLLQEVAVEALSHAGRFQADKQPKAWLLGIGANLIRRRQVRSAKQLQREPLIRDLANVHYVDDEVLFDRLTAGHTPGVDGQYEMHETVTAVLSRLSADDQHIITCAVLLDMSGDALARTLGVKPGTARMRLHRALNRLRTVWPTENEPGGEDEDDA